MTEPQEDIYRVEANADKSLFVSMLVKDIELLPAIMDLIDNSVDGARASTPDDPSAHWVDLQVDAERFVISDNCGGIALDVARHYAFRFGRPQGYDGTPGSVGQFGVGMKRALFKLGRHFVVESRSSSTRFELEVDVDEWLQDRGSDWQFRMKSVDQSYDPGSADVGTVITVTKLHDSVVEDFGHSPVLGQLREQIRMRHQAVLQQGMRITLNGEVLKGFAPALMTGPDFAPINRRFAIKASGGEVFCQIVAGLAAAATDETLDEGQAEEFRSPGDAGWWLFCNNRLLLFGERSSLTGWGDSVAAYHPQYRRFRGYVYLTALNASLLPWNTTKTGVDQDSRIWRQVQGEMKTALAQVVSVINRLKTERQQSDDLAQMPVSRALQTAKPVAIGDVPLSATVVVPKAATGAKKKVARRSIRKIQYDVDQARFRNAADALEVTSAAEVGRLTFDYFYDREVDE